MPKFNIPDTHRQNIILGTLSIVMEKRHVPLLEKYVYNGFISIPVDSPDFQKYIQESIGIKLLLENKYRVIVRPLTCFDKIVKYLAIKIEMISGYGTRDAVGSIDFYPNGGEHQPGCNEKPIVGQLSNITGIFGFVTKLSFNKEVSEKSRECHNHKPQSFPDTKRKRKQTKPNKRKSNKGTQGTKVGSLFPVR